MEEKNQYLDAIGAICSIIITSFLVPLIKSKLNNEQQAKLQTWTTIAVKAAEQLFGSGQGSKKKEYVQTYLADKGMKHDDAMIESCVREHCR